MHERSLVQNLLKQEICRGLNRCYLQPRLRRWSRMSFLWNVN